MSKQGRRSDVVLKGSDAMEKLVPREPVHVVERLSTAGVHMPPLFVAHEVPKEFVPRQLWPGPGGPLDMAEAKGLIPPRCHPRPGQWIWVTVSANGPVKC